MHKKLNPNKFITKKLFCTLFNVNIAGEYQFVNEKFIYRELNDISEVKTKTLDEFIDLIKIKISGAKKHTINLKLGEDLCHSIILKDKDRIIFETNSCRNHVEPFIIAYNWVSSRINLS